MRGFLVTPWLASRALELVRALVGARPGFRVTPWLASHALNLMRVIVSARPQLDRHAMSGVSDVWVSTLASMECSEPAMHPSAAQG